MTIEQQEMIDREYKDALRANDDQRILRAIGNATISLVDCQRKTSDRVKELIEKDHTFENDLEDMRHDLRRVKHVVNEEHGPVVKEFQEGKLRASGAVLFLKIVGWMAATFGSGSVGWLLAVAQKAAEN